MNKIIAIGGMSNFKCFLNVPEKEAIKRYCKYYGMPVEGFDKKANSFKTIEFEDEFEAYDIGEI